MKSAHSSSRLDFGGGDLFGSGDIALHEGNYLGFGCPSLIVGGGPIGKGCALRIENDHLPSGGGSSHGCSGYPFQN